MNYRLIYVLLDILKLSEQYMGQGIQEWTKQNLWKAAFKKFTILIWDQFLDVSRFILPIMQMILTANPATPISSNQKLLKTHFKSTFSFDTAELQYVDRLPNT